MPVSMTYTLTPDPAAVLRLDEEIDDKRFEQNKRGWEVICIRMTL